MRHTEQDKPPGTEASTLEEGGAMSLRSRLSQKVLQKAPLPATARLGRYKAPLLQLG